MGDSSPDSVTRKEAIGGKLVPFDHVKDSLHDVSVHFHLRTSFLAEI